jgi:hypothetical protein
VRKEEQAVLDAARDWAADVRERRVEAAWRSEGGPSAVHRALTVAALDAFPADAEPAPEVVRDVADLRDEEAVLLWGEEFDVRRDGADGLWLRLPVVGSWLNGPLVTLAVAAGAVTRPLRPEPDPAQVERLERLVLDAYQQGTAVEVVARHLLRSGEVALREQQ